MIELLVKNIKKYNSELSICNYITSNDTKIKETQDVIVFTKEELYSEVLKTNSIRGFSCNKLYEKDILLRNNIGFDEDIYIYEDLLFNIKYFENVKKAVYSKMQKYHYVLRKDSAIRSRYITEKDFSVFKALDRIYNIYISNNSIKCNKEKICLNYLIAALDLKEKIINNQCYLDKLHEIEVIISKNFFKVMNSSQISLNIKIKLFFKKAFIRIFIKIKVVLIVRVLF